MYSIETNWLYKKYVIEGLNADEIGKLINCHGATIRRRLKKFNIPFRKRPGTRFPKYSFNKNWLRQKYITENLTCSEIAKLKNCHLETVRRNLKKYNIPIRKPGVAGEKNSFYGKKAALHPAWKGGRYKTTDGYILIYSPEHLNANHQGYVSEHRLVMEKMIGRFLKPEEVVHHKNNIPNDNRPENLELFPTGLSHLNYHKNKKEVSNG